MYQANHVWLWMNGTKVTRAKMGNAKDKEKIAELLGIKI